MAFQMSRTMYRILEDEGLEVRDDYSGRCMYGDRCFGFTGGPETITQFFGIMHRMASGEWDHTSDEADGISEEAEVFFGEEPSLSWDSMGLDMIFYFPRVTVEEDPDLEYDEDEDEVEES